MTKPNPKRDYTTGEVAKICRCSLHQIIRCTKKDLIPSYKLPGSTHRRIPPSGLYNYMTDNNIPTDRFPKEDIPKDALENLSE